MVVNVIVNINVIVGAHVIVAVHVNRNGPVGVIVAVDERAPGLVRPCSPARTV